MKRLFFLLLLFPLIASAQFDFETNKAKFDMVSLPEIESLMITPMPNKISFVNKYSKKISSFKLSKENYREPVSMYEAMASTENYVESDLKISLDAKSFGIYGGNSRYSADGSTKVKNIAYKDAGSGFFFADSCPPNGICPRCAPYRMGRSYY